MKAFLNSMTTVVVVFLHDAAGVFVLDDGKWALVADQNENSYYGD